MVERDGAHLDLLSTLQGSVAGLIGRIVPQDEIYLLWQHDASNSNPFSHKRLLPARRV